MTGDGLRFFRTWLTRPELTGAAAMAREVDPAGQWPVLELGPGTGVVTAALIDRGIAPERIVAVEYNGDFCALLKERFARLNVVEGDAYDLDSSLPPGFAGPFAAAVSSLPLLNRPKDARHALIEAALDRLVPRGVLIQFSYGLGPPVAALAGRFSVDRAAFVLANLPPAQVWVYRRI
jgi:phosphatidylethanolamine/phosphatidyl-N-methylethanolamine N-methyltransferase